MNLTNFLFSWVTVGGKRVCKSCQSRSLMGDLLIIEWAYMGVPGSGSTECGSSCRCQLMPTVLNLISPDMTTPVIINLKDGNIEDLYREVPDEVYNVDSEIELASLIREYVSLHLKTYGYKPVISDRINYITVNEAILYIIGLINIIKEKVKDEQH